MRLYIERFAIPLLATAFFGIITGQLKLQPEIRVSCAVFIGVSALIVAILIDRNRGDGKLDKPGFPVLTLLAVAVASGAIGWLIHNRNPDAPQEIPAATETRSPNSPTESQPIAVTPTSSHSPSPGEPQKGVDVPRSAPTPVTEKEAHSARSLELQSKANVLKYIKAPTRSGHTGNAWTVLMFGVDGSDYPVLRARVELTLQKNGSSTPHIFTNYIDPDEYKDLFNADVLTISVLRDYCDGVVLGRIRSATSSDGQFDGLYDTRLTAEVKLVSTADSIPHEFSVEESGAGFSAEVSMSEAEKRLSDRLDIELSKFLQR